MSERKVPKIRFPGFEHDWQEYSMGELYKERKEPGNDSLPILSVSIHSGISDGELDEENLGKHVRRIEDKSAYKHAHAGDLVFNMMRAWQGAIGSAPSEGMVSPAYITAEPCERVYPPFMDYYVKRKETVEQINSLSYGVTDFRKRLYWDSFVQVKCKLPTLNEQKAIAAELTHIDEMISTTERNLDKWKELKKGMLQKMFPKEGESVPEIRFPGFTDPWEQRKLGEITDSFSGGTPSVGKPEYYGGSIPFIRSAEINSDATELFLTEEGLRNSSAKMVKKGDILYALYGATSGEVGLARLDGAVNQAILDIKPHEGFDAHYIMQWLRKSKESIIGKYLQGGQGNLSGTIVNSLMMDCPCYNEQKRIGGFFQMLDEAITLHQRECDKWQTLKKALLQQMFV